MIKTIIKTFFAVAITISISACSGGSSSTSGDNEQNHSETINQQNIIELEQANSELVDLQEYNQNIIISIVDIEGIPFTDAFVQWKIADSIATEMIDAVCIDDNCTTWVIDQFPSEGIYITAVKFSEQENEPMCSYVSEGELFVNAELFLNATIQEPLEVQIIIEEEHLICEQS